MSLGASLLGIEAVAEPPILPQCLAAPCGELGQAWVLLYLDAPTCGVGEVQMQTVHLEVCDSVNLFLHELFAEEVTAHVKHETTVFKLWLVGDCSCRDCALLVKELENCPRAANN